MRTPSISRNPCGDRIVVGSLFWAGLALTELAALFAILPLLQTALRVVGAAFLIYLPIATAPEAAAPAPV